MELGKYEAESAIGAASVVWARGPLLKVIAYAPKTFEAAKEVDEPPPPTARYDGAKVTSPSLT